MNTVTNIGTNSLFMACKYGHIKTAELLIGEGANPHIHDKEGNTPIKIAMEKGYSDLVSLMTEVSIEKLPSMDLNEGALCSTTSIATLRYCRYQ